MPYAPGPLVGITYTTAHTFVNDRIGCFWHGGRTNLENIFHARRDGMLNWSSRVLRLLSFLQITSPYF